MKTLRESILKSVKAGMHSMDPKNIKTFEDLHEYAKFLYGDLVKDIVDSYPAKYFWIMYNDKLMLRIYSTNNYNWTVRCIFELRNTVVDSELYWSIQETCDTADFETLLNPEKLLKKEEKYYTKLAKKYQNKADKIRRNGGRNCVDREREALDEAWQYEKKVKAINKVQKML